MKVIHILITTVKKWVKEQLPLKKVSYPGRKISWRRWEAITARFENGAIIL
jgi:hypothetical protein